MAKKYSNSYIARFSSIMVIGVGFLLAVVYGLLKEKQDENVRIEKIQEILNSIHIENTKEEAIAKYDNHLIMEVMINSEGEMTSIYKSDQTFEKGATRAFEVNMKKLIKAIKDFNAGKSKTMPDLPLFVMEGEKGDTLYVIPVMGKGLWGPIWGNIALESDMNTICGATFDHKSETPGLGAEINQDFFEEAFIGKKLFDENVNFRSVKTIKGGIKTIPEAERIHGVDAISGGTITSDFLSDMLDFCLSNYVKFLKKEE